MKNDDMILLVNILMDMMAPNEIKYQNIIWHYQMKTI